ncbi:hypothetical protein DFH07DRAFT_795727 [Mycena maculata]|uniref:Uncharacterized protein n=1 Tax=Mycena maculata TaxID=230809 RepID=A0AAD7NWH3_9AGAR|nr:hypothetical protein DFH07DRAFT_795727 [Mycena maculata]
MSYAPYIPLSTSSQPQSPRTPTQAMSMLDEQIDLVDILRSGEDSRLRRHRPERSDALSLPSVVLFCGADQDTEADWDEHRPWVVEMLPGTEPPPARKRQKRSNGCGARIHTCAKADRRWRGLLEGVSVDVVAMQDKYFTADMKRELMLGKEERCGCARNGVGCAICGNPLGALLTPCARHAPSSATNFSTPHYTFLRTGVSPPLPGPGPAHRFVTPSDEARETLQRRIREREDLQQLRARMRVSHSQGRPAPRASDPPEAEAPSPFLTANASLVRRTDRERERRAREEHIAAMRMPELVEADDRRAFEAWADATIQRATATAAAVDVPVVDLSALVMGAEPTVPPRELSEDERRRDWQRSVVATRSSGPSWPPVSRTIERTTAVPETWLTLEEVLGPHSSGDRETEEEQEKEETLPSRPFFDR